jgi:PAS domain S-box-containing protein
MSITGNEDCWATFRESSNPMVLIDENRRIIEANPAMRALTGRSVAESVGHLITDYIPVPDRAAANRVWDRIQATGYAVDEQRITTTSGDYVLFHYAAVRHHIHGVGNGYLAVAIEVSIIPGAEMYPPPAAHVAPGRLTPREDEIVRLIALGRTNNEIAANLHVSPETVRSHIRNAMEKTGARNRAHLVATQYADRLTAAA